MVLSILFHLIAQHELKPPSSHPFAQPGFINLTFPISSAAINLERFELKPVPDVYRGSGLTSVASLPEHILIAVS